MKLSSKTNEDSLSTKSIKTESLLIMLLSLISISSLLLPSFPLKSIEFEGQLIVLNLSDLIDKLLKLFKVKGFL